MTPVPPPKEGLPAGLKRAVVVTMVLSALVGFGASRDLAMIFEPPSLSEMPDNPMAKILPFDPEVSRNAFEAMLRTQAQGLEQMRGSRTVILLLLSMLSSLVFVSALRFLRPGGVPREGIRRLLSGAAIVCAVLRVLDGAQMAAVLKRAGAAADAIYSAASSQAPGGYPDGVNALAGALGMVITSLVFGGGYAVLGSYFRSQRTRDQVASLDASLKS